MTRADEARGELADAGFVPDDRDARAPRLLLEVRDDFLERAFRPERLRGDDRRPGIHRGGHDLRRLLRADERARDDDVERDAEATDAARRLAHARRAVRAQGSLGVVRPGVAAFFGHGVADDVQLVGTWHRSTSAPRRHQLETLTLAAETIGYGRQGSRQPTVARVAGAAVVLGRHNQPVEAAPRGKVRR